VERNVVSLLSSVINIVIIIIFDPGTQMKKLRHAIQKSTKIKLE